VDGVEVDAVRTGYSKFELTYWVHGGTEGLRFPDSVEARRADGLWRHTCFEWFIRMRDGEGYLEFNFSPSTEWAIYRFAAYREGMCELVGVAAPEIITRHRSDSFFQAIVRVDLAGSGIDFDSARMALTAVIETVGGDKSYWSLAHAPGKPDFHHPASFAADLPRDMSEREPR
jgi:hypothetical protein